MLHYLHNITAVLHVAQFTQYNCSAAYYSIYTFTQYYQSSINTDCRVRLQTNKDFRPQTTRKRLRVKSDLAGVYRVQSGTWSIPTTIKFLNNFDIL